jgi:hypothetical protein
MAAVWAVGLASPFSLPPKSFLRGSDLSVCGNKLMNIAAARQLFDELQGYQLGGIAYLWSAAWRLCFIASGI